MPDVLTSPASEADLDAIHDYLYEIDVDVARRVAREFHRVSGLLATRPELGRVFRYADSLRRFPMRPYVIFYRPIPGGIEIARVLHGARDLGAVFTDEDA